jgi:hypothetical protein
MTRHAPALVCLLVVLAGCGATTGGAPATGTLTAAPVPTETPRTTAVPATTTSPPDATHPLVRNHRRATEGRSVTVRVDRTRRAENGTLLGRDRVEGRFAADRSQFRIDSVTTGRPTPSGAERLTTLDGPGPANDGDGSAGRLDRRPPYVDVASELLPADPTLVDRLPVLLGAPTVEVVGQLDLKTYEVAVTTPVDPGRVAALEGVDAAENASLRLLIDQRGVVRYYRFSYTAVVDGRRVTVVERVGFTRLGETGLDAPTDFSWTDGTIRNGTATPGPT